MQTTLRYRTIFSLFKQSSADWLPVSFHAAQSWIAFAILLAPCPLCSTRQSFLTNSKHTLHSSTAHVVTSALRVFWLAGMTLTVVSVTVISLSAVSVLSAVLWIEKALEVRLSWTSIALSSTAACDIHRCSGPLHSSYRLLNRETYRTYIMESWILLGVVVRSCLFPFVRVDRIHAENPAVDHTIRHFHSSQEENHKQQVSFHDDLLAIHARVWQNRRLSRS